MSTGTVSATSVFVDLATKDSLELALYEGSSAITYFVRQTKRSSWFSQVPVILASTSGSSAFGQTFSVAISRSGDYLLQTWIEVVTPALVLAGGAEGLYWCKNFMHNLVDEVSITFNDLVAQKIDSVTLDFWSAFNVPAGKKNAYNQMIGAGVFRTSDEGDDVFIHGLDATVSHTLNLPVPFFFSRDTGVALPVAALPYNDMRISVKIKPILDLLVTINTTAVGTAVAAPFVAAASAGSPTTALAAIIASHSASATTTVAADFTPTSPTITARIFANYAVVSNEERALMGAAARDIVIEQMQSAPIQALKSISAASDYSIRFSHSIKTLYFAIRNKARITAAYSAVGPGCNGAGGDFWSNYQMKTTTAALGGSTISETAASGHGNHLPMHRKSTISSAKLLYENTTRLDNNSSFFTHVNPYYHQETVALQGIHSYSYAIDSTSLDPQGSTNFGKLTNVTLTLTPTIGGTAAAVAASLRGQVSPADIAYDYEPLDTATADVIIVGVNHNIIRVSGGALGFPIFS